MDHSIHGFHFSSSSTEKLMHLWYRLLLILILVLPLSAAAPLTPVGTNHWAAKVEPAVLESAERGKTEFLLFLNQQADLGEAAALKQKPEKSRLVFDRLTGIADRTQKPVLAALRAQGVEHRAYWIANLIWVRGDIDALQAMAQRADVARIYANASVRLDLPTQQSIVKNKLAAESNLWNIDKIGAPSVWAAGYTGQGVVIGGQDTGYEWEHPALKSQYRGWNGTSADHNYHWHDAIHADDPHTPVGNNCGFDIQQPCDDSANTHGTHTMGTMVGGDAGGTAIGVAPGARWIGCRNMEQGWGTPATYIECYQWFVAPTDLNGENPRPDLAPDVINNSWACPPDEGCEDLNILKLVVENVRAAGILTVHSAGNSGSDCSTVNTPAAIYDASFSVGNTQTDDTINPSSSRGPVLVDGSGRLKPDISAPGTSIYSSMFENSYGYLSGTSMAAPHVAGLAALILSAQPDLRGQVDQIEDVIQNSAVQLQSEQTCGGVPGTTIPNNTFGWGRIDAVTAVERASIHTFSIRKSAALFAEPGETITYTIEITHLHPTETTTGVVLTDPLPTHVAFVSATPPCELVVNSLECELGSMAPLESRTVNLVVQAPQQEILLVNQGYGVLSDDAAFVGGQPVYTYIEEISRIYLPHLFKNN